MDLWADALQFLERYFIVFYGICGSKGLFMVSSEQGLESVFTEKVCGYDIL